MSHIYLINFVLVMRPALIFSFNSLTQFSAMKNKENGKIIYI